MSLYAFNEGDSATRRGLSGETIVARYLRKLGYEVTLAPKSRGVFDITATRGADTLLIQVKARSNRNAISSRPYREHGTYIAASAPDGARKIYWVYHITTKTHHLQEITPETFVRISAESLA